MSLILLIIVFERKPIECIKLFKYSSLYSIVQKLMLIHPFYICAIVSDDILLCEDVHQLRVLFKRFRGFSLTSFKREIGILFIKWYFQILIFIVSELCTSDVQSSLTVML